MKRVWAKGRIGVMREDQQLLIDMGTAVVAEYAELAGCTKAIAWARLTALVEHGLAESYKRPGYGKTVFFVATVPAGATVREP